jgi:hypothetical protein
MEIFEKQNTNTHTHTQDSVKDRASFLLPSVMSASQSATHLQEILRRLPEMSIHDVEHLLESAQERRRILQTNSFEPVSREATDCFLAHVPVDITAQVIGAFLTDSDAVSWAQCSKRSLQQIQRRTFTGCASPDRALELMNSKLRHRAAFGLVSSVRVSTKAECSQISILPSSVHSVKFNMEIFKRGVSSQLDMPVHVPESITSLTFGNGTDNRVHPPFFSSDMPEDAVRATFLFVHTTTFPL